MGKAFLSPMSLTKLSTSTWRLSDAHRVPNAATYTKVFDNIRALYAGLPDAKLRGYKPRDGLVSTSPAADVKRVAGTGRKKVDMGLLSDVWVECEVCEGKRFNSETLTIKYKGKNISEVLEMDIDTALNISPIFRRSQED